MNNNDLEEKKNDILLKSIETEFDILLKKFQNKINLDNKNIITKTDDLFKDSDQCLIVLTEAPNNNLIDWATRTYKINSSITKHMINNGFHTDKEWEVIIF